MSLGGSLIVPKSGVDVAFLKKFRSAILSLSKDFKFVVVCGGGSIARTYITGLRNGGIEDYLQSLIGISVTRTNARFMNYFFGRDQDSGIPHDMKHVKSLLTRNDLVFCGALRYGPDQTSDSTAVSLANYLKAKFINLTNVDGLFDKDPRKYKNSKFIKSISSADLFKLANSMVYKPGQHFIIDQKASRLIRDHKVKSFILGNSMKNFQNLVRGRKFRGTEVLV